MITREQVKDLQPGDVVELHRQGWAKDVVVRGTVLGDTCIGELYLGDYSLVSASGQAPVWLEFPDSTLTVVSRAPRPLYVNHPRTEPVPGDVVTAAPDEDGYEVIPGWRPTWSFTERNVWIGTYTGTPIRSEMVDRLILLVDGETGQVVP